MYGFRRPKPRADLQARLTHEVRAIDPLNSQRATLERILLSSGSGRTA